MTKSIYPDIESTEEIWKDIPGYEGRYLVSNHGGLYSLITDDFLQFSPHDGYFRVKIGKKTFRMHRLVATVFIPNPDNKPEVNHISGIKRQNNAGNLEWSTNQENVDHSLETGLAKCVNSKEQRVINRIKYDSRMPKSEYMKKYSRKIFQISKHGGELIKVWDSIGEAARGNNIPKPGLKVTLSQNKPSYKGYRWQYYEIVDMST
jgi:hypothetical protein